MKTKIIKLGFILVLLLSSTSIFSQVGIGTTTPNPSAMLDVDVSSLTGAKKGFLPPRMAEADRDLIGSPASGLLIYNTDTDQLNYYNGTDWQAVVSGVFNNITNKTDVTGYGNIIVNDTLTPKGRLMLPMGELSYFSMTGTVISIPNQSDGTTNMVAVNPVTAITAGAYEFDSPSPGILRYTGANAKMFHIAITISGTPNVSNNVFVFGVAKSGTIIASGKVLGSSSGTQFSSLHIMLTLTNNQTLQLFMGNIDGANKPFTVKSLNFFAMGM